MISDLKEIGPWLTSLPTVPKLLATVIIVSLFAMVMYFMWFQNESVEVSKKSVSIPEASGAFQEPFGQWATREGKYFNSGHTLQWVNKRQIAVRFYEVEDKGDSHPEFTAYFDVSNDPEKAERLRKLFVQLDGFPTSVSGTVDKQHNLKNARVSAVSEQVKN